MAALTGAEKERVRYHLGYLASASAASMQFGMARPIQTVYLLESAMEMLVDQNALDRVRRVLFTLDEIETKMQSALCSMIAEQLGTLKLRGDYTTRLEAEYTRWANRLADILGVPKYLFSARFQRRGPGTSVPVG